MATTLQMGMLYKIVDDENFDGRSTWVQNIVKTNEDKGVFTSLLKPD